MDFLTIFFAFGIVSIIVMVFMGLARMKKDRMPSLEYSIEENKLIIGEAYLPIFRDMCGAITKIFSEGD